MPVGRAVNWLDGPSFAGHRSYQGKPWRPFFEFIKELWREVYRRGGKGWYSARGYCGIFNTTTLGAAKKNSDVFSLSLGYPEICLLSKSSTGALAFRYSINHEAMA